MLLLVCKCVYFCLIRVFLLFSLYISFIIIIIIIVHGAQPVNCKTNKYVPRGQRARVSLTTDRAHCPDTITARFATDRISTSVYYNTRHHRHAEDCRRTRSTERGVNDFLRHEFQFQNQNQNNNNNNNPISSRRHIVILFIRHYRCVGCRGTTQFIALLERTYVPRTQKRAYYVPARRRPLSPPAHHRNLFFVHVYIIYTYALYVCRCRAAVKETSLKCTSCRTDCDGARGHEEQQKKKKWKKNSRKYFDVVVVHVRYTLCS